VLPVFRRSLYVFLLDALFLICCLVGVYHVAQKPALSVQVSEEHNAPAIHLTTPKGVILSLNNINIHTEEELEFLLDGFSKQD